jgi:hypothetical protein
MEAVFKRALVKQIPVFKTMLDVVPMIEYLVDAEIITPSQGKHLKRVKDGEKQVVLFRYLQTIDKNQIERFFDVLGVTKQRHIANKFIRYMSGYHH